MRSSSLKPFVVPMLVAMGVFLTVAAVDIGLKQAAHTRERQIAHTNSDRAAEILSEGAARVSRHLVSVGAVIGQASTSGASLTAQFHEYIDETQLLEGFPMMNAIAFMQYALPDEVDDIVRAYNSDAARAAQGYPILQRRPVQDLPHHAMVAVVIPETIMAQRGGFDLMGTPRRATLERAIQTRKVQMTARIKLFSTEPGVAAFHPVYETEGDPLPIGFVATAFVAKTFLSELEASLAPLDLEIEIHDLGYDPQAVDGLSAETFLMATNGTDTGSWAARTLVGRDILEYRDIQVADRVWRLVIRPANIMPSALRFDVFMGLGVLTGLLAGCLFYRKSRSEAMLSEQVALRTKDLHDMTEELRQQQSDSEHAATHDELTGLLNRRGLRQNFDRFETDTAAGRVCALIAIDLDGFKDINDTMGHMVGDMLLQKVSRFLASEAPPASLVSRLGGDEFAVFLAVDTEEEALAIAQSIVDWCGEPQDVDGFETRFGASVGVSSCLRTQRCLSALLGDADIALYDAKRNGRGRIVLFDQDLRQVAMAKKHLVDDLKRALENDEFVPFYQTQHDAKDHAIVGVEALVRWAHPTKGIQVPDAFLEAAEAAGILQEIDNRMLQRAVQDMITLDAAGLTVPKLSVNVSLSRLHDPDLHNSIAGLPSMKTQLCFEILEAVFMDDAEDATNWGLFAIQEQGIHLEVDDFGSGRASIIALTKLAPQRLKIDRGLVANFLEREGQDRLIGSIVEMGTALGIGVTAEGVQTGAEADRLRTLGVDTLQGYHFARPCGLDDLKKAVPRWGMSGSAGVRRA